MKTKRIPLTFTIVQGPEGLALYLNAFRIAGPKPWGGGKVVHEWTVDAEDLLQALNHSTKIVTDTATQALKKLKAVHEAALRSVKKKTKPQ